MADSWKTDGNCNECRRKDYCNKQCRLARQRMKAMVYSAFTKTPVGKVYDQIIDSQYHDFMTGR